MKRKELLNVLEKVKPGIASKDIVESMTYFYFSGTDVITYNDKISIQHPLKTDFSLFVKANDLFKVASKLNADELKLTQKDDKLNIRCSKLNANLATINDEEITERISSVEKSLKKAKWKDTPDNFIEALTLCSFTASTQESDNTLTCVKVDGSDCVASDNKRISHAILNSPMDEMFVKASEIKNLASINPTSYAIQKSWIHFKNEDGCIFSIRKMDGSFPDFMQFFDFEGKSLDLPKNILEGMDIAEIFADDSDPAITIKIADKYCIVSVKSDSGTMQYRSKIDYSGEEVKFIINPEFLKQMMQHSSSIIISDDKVKLETDDKMFSIVTALYSN